MKKNRKKLYRFLLLFSIVNIILSCFSVSAAMPGGVNSVYPLNVNSIKVLVKSDNDEFIEVSVSSTGRDVTDGRVQFTVARTDGKNWNVNEKFFVDVYMSVDADAERYYSADYCVSALYRLTVSTNCIINKAENNYFARADLEDEHIVYDGTFEKEADNVIDVKYPYSNIGDSFRRYYNRFRITFNKTQSYFTLNLLGVKFTSITHEQALREDLITNQNENTDKLIANQEKNTKEIIENEKKIANQIINGGTDKPHYKGADTTVIDEYESSVKEVEDSTKEGREQAISIFNGFGGNIQSGTIFGKGLLFVSQVFKVFFDVGWLSDLTGFSLALGVFAFILGVTAIVVKFTSQRGD